MKTAYAYWDNRIAPVFDSAQQILVVDTDGSETITETQQTLPNSTSFHKAAHLVELGINTLVCGAISRPLHEWLLARGISVMAFIAGDLKEVIHALQDGNLESNCFAMPGCNRRRQRGLGMGMGNELGRGLGRGMGRGVALTPDDEQNNVTGHGLGLGRGMGRGSGLGRGIGRGMGRGRNNQN